FSSNTLWQEDDKDQEDLENENQNKIDDNYPLAKEWALKENQELGRKAYSTRVYKILQKFILSGEIEQDDVSKVSTIQNWISSKSKKV
ncbi:10929_t:CDS:2, partial [Gigaspora margarita]